VPARRKGWTAVLLAGAAGVAAVGPLLLATAPPAAAASSDVDVINFAFNPSTITINPGDKIIWTNDSPVAKPTTHSVTADGNSPAFDEDLGKRGAQFEQRFPTAGTYTYHCKYHAQMTGTIQVGAPATTTTVPPTTTTTTAPPTTTTTAPATTTSTAAPTTTTTAAPPRPAASSSPVPAPPVPHPAAAPPPAPSSTTTSAPSTTTTTAAPPTTATSAAPPTTAAPAPPTTAGKAGDTGDKIPTAAGPPASPGGELDLAAVALVSALVGVGAFGAWTLIKVRPGRI